MVTLIRLYSLYCTHYFCTLSLTRLQLTTQVALSFAVISDFFHFMLQCTLHWLQLLKRFSLRFCFEVYKLSFLLLEVGCSYHSTQFQTQFCFCVARFFFVCTVLFNSCTDLPAAPVLDPGPTSDPALIFVSGFKNFFYNPVQSRHCSCDDFLPYSGCHIFFLVGRRSLHPLDFNCFLSLPKHVSKRFGSTYRGGSNNSGQTLSLQ